MPASDSAASNAAFLLVYTLKNQCTRAPDGNSARASGETEAFINYGTFTSNIQFPDVVAFNSRKCRVMKSTAKAGGNIEEPLTLLIGKIIICLKVVLQFIFMILYIAVLIIPVLDIIP